MIYDCSSAAHAQSQTYPGDHKCVKPVRCSAERFLTALSGGDIVPSASGDSSTSSVSKPSSLTFGVPAGSPGLQGDVPVITPTLGPRTQARTGTAAHLGGSAAGGSSEGAPHSASSSSVQASMHSMGHSSQPFGVQSGSEVDDAVGPAGGLNGGLSARMLEPSGRVSSELRQSSSATSEELEQLLQQLSQYEEHLLEEAQTVGGLPPELAGQAQLHSASAGRGEVDTSLDSSVSWSQTLAGLTGLTSLAPPDSS